MNDNLSMNNTLVGIKEGFNRGNLFDNLFIQYVLKKASSISSPYKLGVILNT